ncbi:hypothetical protein [Herbiconiux daphne]|uniref:Uncharacterized protein n=1 Tax=Herbiconiux daphne TaxID=2970914 RepID=A0ABT2GX28_9MICO|nr:hypothetical protein [Herbiconiux daphne]MCS5732487.1 hypothetical protein [Herbiconiux daphne]
MYDLGTWIIIAAIAAVILAIVVFSMRRGRQRGARSDAPTASGTGDERAADATPGKPEDRVGDNTLGDRSDVVRRARRGF